MAYNHDYGQYHHNLGYPTALPEQQQLLYHPNLNVYQPTNLNAPPLSARPQKSDNMLSDLLVAQEKAAKKRVVQRTGLIAFGIVICTVGMIFALLSFICVFHHCQVSRNAIVSTAPLGPVLTISQVTSHVAPLSVPIVMGLLSYLLSAKWLRSSANGGPNRPSPMQLGLLMSMCDGAGIGSLFGSVKYVLKKPSTGQKIVQPPILRQAIILLGSMLAVTYLTAAADSWLHASSKSVIIPFTSTYNSLIVPDFGREINNTRCNLLQGTAGDQLNPVNADSCGLISGGSGGSGTTLGEGIRVVSNTSTLHSIVFADDQTALVIPQSLPSNITYSARTLGVKSECVSITQQCIPPPTYLAGIPWYGPDAQLDLNCSAAGINYINGTGQTSLCPLDNQGLCTFGFEVQSNPVATGEIVTSNAYLSPGQANDVFIPNTGWFVHGNGGAWNIVYCNTTALDVTYRYESSRFILESAAPQSVTVARYIMSALFIDYTTTAISYAVDGAGLQPNTTYEGMYAMEMSRQLLARAAFIYEPRSVDSIQSQNFVNGSKLQLVPLILFLGALVVFLLQVVYIAIMTITAAWGMQYVGLAARHLSNPIAAMQKLYGHPDPDLSWEMDSEKGFGSETEGDRLCVGPVLLSNNGLPSSVFTIGKG